MWRFLKKLEIELPYDIAIPLLGNPTLILVRESRYTLHLRQKTQGPSHIPIAEGRLLLRYLFKVGLTVQ